MLATVPLHTYSWLSLFRWFHLGLTVGCDYGGYGPPCVGALIRTFLWLSVDHCSLAGMALLFQLLTGTLVCVLATVPPHLLFGFLLFRWFHLGLTVELDYGGCGPPCVGAFDPNFPLAFLLTAALSRGWPLLTADGDAGLRARHRPLHTYSLVFSYFWWFHLGLTVEQTTAAAGRLAGALIRTFLWFLLTSRSPRGDGPCLFSFDGGRWLACSPPSLHTYSWLSLYFGGFIWG